MEQYTQELLWQNVPLTEVAYSTLLKKLVASSPSQAQTSNQTLPRSEGETSNDHLQRPALSRAQNQNFLRAARAVQAKPVLSPRCARRRGQEKRCQYFLHASWKRVARLIATPSHRGSLREKKRKEAGTKKNCIRELRPPSPFM